MRFMMLILFLCLASQGYSQSSLPPAVEDSLFSVWLDESKADSSRLKAIRTISWDGYLFSKPDSAFYYAGLQLQFAQQVENLPQQADAYNTQGASRFFVGEVDRAIELFEKCLAIHVESGDELAQAKVLNNLGIMCDNLGRIDEAVEYYEKSLLLNRKSGNIEGVASTMINIGVIYEKTGRMDSAIANYTEGLKVYEELGNEVGISSALNNLGLAYKTQGRYIEAIKVLTRSLKIDEASGDDDGLATTLTNIGVILIEQNELDEALEYLLRSIKINEVVGDKRGLANCYDNVGIIHKRRGEYDAAMDYYRKGLKINEEIKSKRGVAGTVSNMGSIHVLRGQPGKAIPLFDRSLEIYRELDFKQGMARSLSSLANAYRQKGQPFRAVSYAQEALEISRELEAPKDMRDASENLYLAYKKGGDEDKALEMLELFLELDDSIEAEENKREIVRQKYKYQYEKKSAADSIRNLEEERLQSARLAAERAKKEKHRAEAEQQEERAMLLVGILGIAIGLGLFLVNRFRVTRKQKSLIEEQKDHVDRAYEELEEKNQEIVDSIQYAKRIQTAILPPQKVVKEYLTDSFILYKPKDIVAGDFFWMEPKHRTVLFAAADCTGHGVPGAMVSVVCNNGLNRSVREFGLTDPASILNKTREIVIEEFEKSEDEVKDGMDIALVSLNMETGEGAFAGANNPLWIIRQGGEFEDIRGDKLPIGKYSVMTDFSRHQFKLESGDCLYIFSDGYADQFGGPKGKKFKSINLKNLLVSISDRPMSEQCQTLEEEFEKWRGDLEQIDDVCIIGMRL